MKRSVSTLLARVLVLQVLALLCSFSFSSRARAQSLPSTLRLAPELALHADQVPHNPKPSDRAYRFVKVGYRLRASGIGLLLGGTSAVLLGARGYDCPRKYPDDAQTGPRTRAFVPMAIGGLALSAGVSFTIAGTGRIRLARKFDQPLPSPGALRSASRSPTLGFATAAAPVVTAGLLMGAARMFICSAHP